MEIRAHPLPTEDFGMLRSLTAAFRVHVEANGILPSGVDTPVVIADALDEMVAGIEADGGHRSELSHRLLTNALLCFEKAIAERIMKHQTEIITALMRASTPHVGPFELSSPYATLNLKGAEALKIKFAAALHMHQRCEELEAWRKRVDGTSMPKYITKDKSQNGSE